MKIEIITEKLLWDLEDLISPEYKRTWRMKGITIKIIIEEDIGR